MDSETKETDSSRNKKYYYARFFTEPQPTPGEWDSLMNGLLLGYTRCIYLPPTLPNSPGINDCLQIRCQDVADVKESYSIDSY